MYVNTTCTEPVSASSGVFSGYRWVKVTGGDVRDFVYREPRWSYPFHAGVVPGEKGEESSRGPALSLMLEAAGGKVEAGNTVRGRVANHLDRGFPSLTLEFYIPAHSQVKVLVGEEDAVLSPWPTSDPDIVRVEARFPMPPRAEREVVIEVGRRGALGPPPARSLPGRSFTSGRVHSIISWVDRTSRCIWLVPSTIWSILASRKNFSTKWSFM